jgi:hypothetical protein
MKISKKPWDRPDHYSSNLTRRGDTLFRKHTGYKRECGPNWKITLPGVTGVNEGPVVDCLTGSYVANVVLIKGEFVRVPIEKEIV